MIAAAWAFLGLLSLAGTVLTAGAVGPVPRSPGNEAPGLFRPCADQASEQELEQDTDSLAAAAPSRPDLAGTYVGQAPAHDAAERTYSLVLTPDGRALWNTFYLHEASASLTARWQQNGSELVLNFDPLGSWPAPRPITFHYHHHELRPIHWDQSEWGLVGPPVLHRVRGRAAAANS